MTRLEALEKVAEMARRCVPPEAYFPKNEGTAVYSLAKALEELDQTHKTDLCESCGGQKIKAECDACDGRGISETTVRWTRYGSVYTCKEQLLADGWVHCSHCNGTGKSEQMVCVDCE